MTSCLLKRLIRYQTLQRLARNVRRTRQSFPEGSMSPP